MFFMRRYLHRARFGVSKKLTYSRNKIAPKRDYSRRGRMSNPHVSREKRADWVFRLKIAMITVSVLIMIGLGLYHPFFSISDD